MRFHSIGSGAAFSGQQRPYHYPTNEMEPSVGGGGSGAGIIYDIDFQSAGYFGPGYGGDLLLDWKDGDGTTPTVWGGSALTAGGSPAASSRPLPWEDSSGTRLDQTVFADDENYRSTDARLDPGNADLVAVVVATVISDALPAIIFSTRNDGSNDAGIRLQVNSGTDLRAATKDTGGTVKNANYTGCVQPNVPFVALARFDKDGDLALFVNADPTAHTVAGTGVSIDGGDGFGINADPGGDFSKASAIHRVCVWEGTGIADAWTDANCTAYLQAILGIAPMTGPALTFARASMASHVDSDGRLHLASLHMPRCGDADGYRAESGMENKSRRNLNPVDGTTWTDGATNPTAVDDSTALATAKLECLGANVYQYVNSSGSSKYLRDVDIACETDNTNKHSLSVFARIVAGSGAEIGWWDKSGSTWTKVGDISDNYARTKVENLTPPDVDCVLCIHIPDGCTLRWIGHQCVELSYCSTFIPVWSTTGSETRAADALTLGRGLSAEAGAQCIELAPLGWTAQPPSNYEITAAGVANILVSNSSSPNSIQTTDGSLTFSMTPATLWDGPFRKILNSWSAAFGQWLEAIGLQSASEVFDGAMQTDSVRLPDFADDYAWSIRRYMILSKPIKGYVPW